MTQISFSYVSFVCSSIKEWPESTCCCSPVSWMLTLTNWWVPVSSAKIFSLNPNQLVKMICYCISTTVRLFIPPVNSRLSIWVCRQVAFHTWIPRQCTQSGWSLYLFIYIFFQTGITFKVQTWAQASHSSWKTFTVMRC